MNISICRLLSAITVISVALPMTAGANAPAGQYVVTAGATVYDTKSKLTWQQTVSSTTYAWTDAKTYCAGEGASLGGTGWRLPTLKELQTIVDYSKTTGPLIDLNAFPGTPASNFWSSSVLGNYPSYAWDIDFNSGVTGDHDVSSMEYVRCVR